MKNFDYDHDYDLQQSNLLKPELIADLIGHIHDAAADPANWPVVIEAVDKLLSTIRTSPRLISDGEIHTLSHGSSNALLPDLPAQTQWTATERRLWQILTPHFVRADAIRQQISVLEKERDVLDIVLDRLPMGSALIDECGQLVYANREFYEILEFDGLLRLSDGVLAFTSQADSGPSLATLIEQAQKAEAGLPFFRQAGEDKSGKSTSLFISRSPERNPNHGPSRLLLCVARRFRRELSLGGLISQYALTPAEARLTQQLAQGLTLDAYAVEQGISSSTARTQLKAVFAKTGVSRQAELIATLYASPLWLNEDKPVFPHSLRAPDEHGDATSCLELPDGRILYWSDNGDPRGKPVILMHGISGSRSSRHPDDLPLLDAGLRLLIPERPGSGESSPQKDRQITDWIADMQALTAHLGLHKFAVLGYSAGTPYALAVAAAMPERVTHVALVAPMYPMRSSTDLANYTPAFRLPLLVARTVPGLLGLLMRVMVRGVQKSPYVYLMRTLESGTESDRAVFLNPRLRQAYIKGLLAGTRGGEQELTREVLLLACDWRIDFKALPSKIRVWHGAADKLVAPEGAQALTRMLGNPTLHLIEQAGHYVLFSHWQELCSAISAFMDE
jgi:pimeloyl-ACP methyl ester carboxylesterase/DNA-binding CsgD family transcriptional regulator/PAS domain-containing protein